MNIQPVGNRDRCGKCGARHGGNNHLCDVHGRVSDGCCSSSCKPGDYVKVRGELKLRAKVDLSGLNLDPPYRFQDNGSGGYKPEYVERYV
jgi:hypothetical protein